MRTNFVMTILCSAAMIGLVGATSCSDRREAQQPAAGCDSPGVTADEITIGLVTADTGAGSGALASARSGVDARLGLANDGGGVHGRKIVYRWRDDASSPNQNAQVVGDLLRSGSVFGLLSITTALSGSLDTTSAQGVPVVGLAVADWARYPNLFAYAYNTSPQTLGRYIQRGGGTKVGILTTGSAVSVLQSADRFRTAFEEIGLSTIDSIAFSSGADSPLHVARRLAEAGADTLVGLTSPDDFAAVIAAARETNLNLAVSISLSGYSRDMLPRLGRALAGVTIPVYFRPFEAGGTAIDRYREAMIKYAPETQPEQEFAMYGYIFADLLLRGLEGAGECPARETFMTSLRKVRSFDAGGLVTPVDLTTNALIPLDCYAFVRVNRTGTAFQVARERLCADDTTGSTG
ncbi:ABC-type branched-chain amino acid transport system, substrate-binding protein [Parafrankia irregularis]|uniref:ABC-type branched-chain amino acid transport system, substrate-binding protein n=1 Tax=Parafrankia irregularis TaxID=795642 RepID=A0A0S4QX97_9ACTN|nr:MULTISPECIES: ABC transporter substrate-binding protein [Parafrankia]MBE3200332.1 ABC transporter substrate-binding protein [Parafrankia sp. CH37]CUU59759.1 ABC-type branched-chain amino acid transport system, substrate-binding protein [Parafrankia irregularis]